MQVDNLSSTKGENVGNVGARQVTELESGAKVIFVSQTVEFGFGLFSQIFIIQHFMHITSACHSGACADEERYRGGEGEELKPREGQGAGGAQQSKTWEWGEKAEGDGLCEAGGQGGGAEGEEV